MREGRKGREREGGRERPDYQIFFKNFKLLLFYFNFSFDICGHVLNIRSEKP